MADPIGLLKSVVQLLQAVRDAVEGAEAVQTTMRDRLGDYASVLDTLQENPERVAVFNIEHELGRLQTLFGDTQDTMKNAVSPGDCLCVRLCKMVNLSFKHKSLTEELDTIDKDVDRIFGAINVKMGCRAAVLPSLPDMARVPEGAGKSRVADIYVERNSYLEEVVQGITQDVGGISSAPWVVVGMGGAGKSVLAASVVRNTDTRQHYRQGIFWVSVGQHKKEQLVALFLPLVWAMRQAATDHQYAVPSSFENPESLAAHLRAVTEATPRPRLVVLDNVWEREVVDFLMETGLNLLVTTRDASIVNRQSGQTNVGNMSDDQAVRLLLKASSKTASMPAAEVKAAILKVAQDCARLPLALAIAGSSIVEGGAHSLDQWERLHAALGNRQEMQWMKQDGYESLGAVLSFSFEALPIAKKKTFLALAVLPKGIDMRLPMLQNLWDIEDIGGAREEALFFVSRCLLHSAGDEYGMHDLLRDFATSRIDSKTRAVACDRQANFLRSLDLLSTFANDGEFAEGLYTLMALWRSVNELGGGATRHIGAYSSSLDDLRRDQNSGGNARLRWALGAVARLFRLQGETDQAMCLHEESLALRQEALGDDHEDVAKTLSKMAVLARDQGNHAKAREYQNRSDNIRKKQFEPDHPRMAQSLNERGVLLSDQGNFADAEPLFREAWSIYEKNYGADDLRVAVPINNLAGVLSQKGEVEEAKRLYERCLDTRRNELGPDHLEVASVLNSLARLFADQEMYDDAVANFTESLRIREEKLGPSHPDVARSLKNLADMWFKQGEYGKALEPSSRALAVLEQAFKPEDRLVLDARKRKARIIRYQKRAEARQAGPPPSGLSKYSTSDPGAGVAVRGCAELLEDKYRAMSHEGA